MATGYERYFVICGYRLTISPEFDQYNVTRSQQARQIDAISRRYAGVDVLAGLQADLDRLIGDALNSFKRVVSIQVKTTSDVASVGFIELQRHQSEVLARIGKRLIFKYAFNEYISISEVAQHLTLDTQKYFAGFVNEVERLEKGRQNYQLRQAYDRLTRSQPQVTGIGLGAKGAMEVAAGTVAVNVGFSVMRGIGGLISNAIQSSIDSDNSKKAVEHGIKALYEAYEGLCKQLVQYVCNYLSAAMSAEIADVGRKPFRNISDEKEKATAAKWENYKNAFQHGDIKIDKYVAFLVSLIEELPHRLTVYYDLYQLAFDVGNEEAQKSILNFTNYLGFDGQMKRWLAANRITPPILTKEDEARLSGIVCPNCGKENKAHANFCKGCGQILGEVKVCPACGNQIKPGKKFCSKCGTGIC